MMRVYANKLREMRERSGITQKELAERSGCRARMIADIEDGDLDMSRLKLGEAAAIANALDMTLDDVFTREIADDTGERIVYRIFTSGSVLIASSAELKPTEGITREYSGELICADNDRYETLEQAREALGKLNSHISEPMSVWNKGKRIYEVKEYFIEGVYVDHFSKEQRTDGSRIYAKFK